MALAAASYLAAGTLPPTLAGHDTAWRFDVPQVVVARDVSTAEFLAISPQENLLEVQIPVSTRVASSKSSGSYQLTFELTGYDPAWFVVDFQPRTSLAAEVEGPIAVEQRQESARSVGLTVTSAWDHLVKASGSSDLGQKSSTYSKYESLPPLTLISASGTVDRGRGVYFKFRPSPRTTQEGSRTLSLTLRVPRSWSTDFLRVTCRAELLAPARLEEMLGQALPGAAEVWEQSFPVILYREGDSVARRRAYQVAEAEQALRQQAIRHAQEIDRRRRGNPVHQVATLLDIAEPRIPADWLNRFLDQPRARHLPPYAHRLPVDVRKAMNDCLAARRGHPGSESAVQGKE